MITTTSPERVFKQSCIFKSRIMSHSNQAERTALALCHSTGKGFSSPWKFKQQGALCASPQGVDKETCPKAHSRQDLLPLASQRVPLYSPGDWQP